MILKLLAAMLVTVQILDLGATRYVSGDQTRFQNLTDYKNFCCTAIGKQLVIKGKKNINLSVKNIVLKLLDMLYIPGFIMNLISIAKLQHNSIGVYFSPGQTAKLSFDGKIVAYRNNVENQFILWQS